MSHCLLCPCKHTASLVPDGSGRNGVLIVADALADADAASGRALVGREGAMLARALSRYGWAWDDFWCASAAFCQPSPAQAGHAAQVCSALGEHVRAVRPRAYLTLGTHAFEKLTGQRVSPLLARGYVWPVLPTFGGGWAVAALPPTYYRQDPGLLTTFLSDAAKAIRVAAEGFSYDETIRSVWAPPVAVWDTFVADFLTDPSRPLALDIETPWKRKADMTDAEKQANEDASYTIDEVNLCYDGITGVSVPWDQPQYHAGVCAMVAASQARGTTLFWNAAYDVPRLEHNAFPTFAATATRDTMDAFHVWRNNVRRKLAVATSLLPSCWNVRPWKHLGTGNAFYRAMDVISLWRNDRDVLALLKAEGQWDAYRLCVADLDPHLQRMTTAGVGVDLPKVTDLLARTAVQLTEIQGHMTACVPPELLPTQVWKTRRAAEAGLERLRAANEVSVTAALTEVPSQTEAWACAVCGLTPCPSAHVTRKTLDSAPASA